jgi:hypothetical protein
MSAQFRHSPQLGPTGWNRDPAPSQLHFVQGDSSDNSVHEAEYPSGQHIPWPYRPGGHDGGAAGDSDDDVHAEGATTTSAATARPSVNPRTIKCFMLASDQRRIPMSRTTSFSTANN